MKLAILPETVALVLDVDKDKGGKAKKDAPVWTFRPLGISATTDLIPVLVENPRAGHAQAFRSHFVSVTNVEVDGVPFEIDKHFENALPYEVAWELGQKLVDRAYLKDTDRGK